MVVRGSDERVERSAAGRRPEDGSSPAHTDTRNLDPATGYGVRSEGVQDDGGASRDVDGDGDSLFERADDCHTSRVANLGGDASGDTSGDANGVSRNADGEASRDAVASDQEIMHDSSATSGGWSRDDGEFGAGAAADVDCSRDAVVLDQEIERQCGAIGRDEAPDHDSDESSTVDFADHDSTLRWINHEYKKATDSSPFSSLGELSSAIRNETLKFVAKYGYQRSFSRLLKVIGQEIGADLTSRRQYVKAVTLELVIEQENVEVMELEDYDVDWSPEPSVEAFMKLLSTELDLFVMTGFDLNFGTLYPWLCARVGVNLRSRWVLVRRVLRHVLDSYGLEWPGINTGESGDNQEQVDGEDEADRLARAGGDNPVLKSPTPDAESSPDDSQSCSQSSSEDAISSSEYDTKSPLTGKWRVIDDWEGDLTVNRMTKDGLWFVEQSEDSDYVPSESDGDMIDPDDGAVDASDRTQAMPDAGAVDASVTDVGMNVESGGGDNSTQAMPDAGAVNASMNAKSGGAYDHTEEMEDEADRRQAKMYSADRRQAMLYSAKWKPRSLEWKRLRQNVTSPNNKLPPGYFHIDRVVDMRVTDTDLEYLVVWSDAPLKEKRSWIGESHFIEISQFRDDIEMVMKWKQSGLNKRDFMRSSAEARQWLLRKRSMGDDGDRGWCAYRSVGTAIELLGARNPITPDMISSFVELGAKRRKVDGFYGVRWNALKAFVAKLRDHGVIVDMNVFSNNRRKNGEVGVDGLASMALEDGVYLVGGFPKDSSKWGHCIVLDVQESRVDVYDEDEMLDVDDLDWLHRMSYVSRVKLQVP